MAPITGQLVAYAAGARRRFDVQLDLRGTEFQRACWHELQRIPFGSTRTYGQVARRLSRRAGAAGSAGAARSARAMGPAGATGPAGLVGATGSAGLVGATGPVGSAGSARAVGQANGANPVPIFVPCHRVLANDGLGGFGGGVELKRRLLQLEGSLLPIDP
ncbi:MAG: methylated-DNA--[protein]-cysteine S-methyltransferase [Planctomycetota bacterium]